MVGIVILNFNNSNATKDCLESIFKYESFEHYKLCLVDNSTDTKDRAHIIEYIDVLKRNNPLISIHVILLDKNEGYAKGNNVGIRYFEQDKDISQILILNNDIIFTMPMLKGLEDYLYKHEECAVVSPLLYNKKGKIDVTCARRSKDLYSFLARTPLIRKFKWVHRRNKSEYILKEQTIDDFTIPMYIDLPSGSCMMFDKEIFKGIGYFDPHTFLYFEEDILWSKLQKIGKKSVMLPYLSCIHLGASSISKQPSKTMERHYFISMLYYLKRYSELNDFWTWIIQFMVKRFYKI